MVFKYSTDALVWYSNSTAPFPRSSHGSARKGDKDETSDDDNQEEQRYNVSYIGHSRASVPKGCCTVKTCIRDSRFTEAVRLKLINSDQH